MHGPAAHRGPSHTTLVDATDVFRPERLAAVGAMNLLDAEAEASFDRLTAPWRGA